MNIPETISLGIIANGAYDLLKQSTKITFGAIMNVLNRPLNADEEAAVKTLVSFLENIPEEYRSSPDGIQEYLNEKTSAPRAMQSASGKGAVIINGNVKITGNIGGEHTHVYPSTREKKNT